MKKVKTGGLAALITTLLAWPAFALQTQPGTQPDDTGQTGRQPAPAGQPAGQPDDTGEPMRAPSRPTPGTGTTGESPTGSQPGQRPAPTGTEPGQAPEGTAPAEPGTEPEPSPMGAQETPGMDLAQATELSRSALVHIMAASAAIERQQNDEASRALDAAAGSLRQLYGAVPAGTVLSQLGTNEPGEPMDLAPVVSEVQAQSVWMDPEVVANVEEAQRQMEKGNQAAAEQKLLLAREKLVADVALLPLEDAYARVQAARAELRDGRPEYAARLLEGVPLAIQHIQVATPIVPVRFNLRAAAAAAEEGNWDKAGELVNQATATLNEMAAAPGSDEMKKDMESLAKRAERLNSRLEQGRKPRPTEMRDLARRTQALSATL